MLLIDFLKRRKHVVTWESEGMNLALYLINEFPERSFNFKGFGKRHTKLSAEELLKLIQEEMDKMLILYRYETKAKTFLDKKGESQAKIRLLGKASMMSKYNPLDIELLITTKTQNN